METEVILPFKEAWCFESTHPGLAPPNLLMVSITKTQAWQLIRRLLAGLEQQDFSEIPINFYGKMVKVDIKNATTSSD